MTQEPNKHSSLRRVQKKKKPAPGGRKKREKIIMVVAIILAVIMVLAATVVVLYNRWVQKPTLPVNDDPAASSSASLAPGESEEPLGHRRGGPPVQWGAQEPGLLHHPGVRRLDETSSLTDTSWWCPTT